MSTEAGQLHLDDDVGLRGGRPADHPGCRRLPDPDRPPSATAPRRVRDPLPGPRLFRTSAPSLLAQSDHRAAGRLPGTTLPGLCGPAMGFSRPIPRGAPSHVWASVSASSPGSAGGLGSPADPGRVPEASPDLMISDIGMPMEDGYVLVRRLMEDGLGRHLPAIALTAYASDEDSRPRSRPASTRTSRNRSTQSDWSRSPRAWWWGCVGLPRLPPVRRGPSAATRAAPARVGSPSRSARSARG
jgi:CheY-like chemotaxis protein